MRFLKNPNFLLAILLASVLSTAYFFDQNLIAQRELAAIKKNPNLVTQQEAKDLISRIGLLVQLPKGEQPTIATVTDVSKLKGQAFFANAKNGDKLLIYLKAAKAYLYSVSMNKILEVAPVTVNQNPAQVAGVKTETPTPAPKK